MFDVQFKDIKTIAHFDGEDMNTAEVVVTGPFVPKVAGFRFVYSFVISDDQQILYLAQWDFLDGSPGYRVWKVNAADRTVHTSERISGYCDRLEAYRDRILAQRWRIEVVDNFKEGVPCTN